MRDLDLFLVPFFADMMRPLASLVASLFNSIAPRQHFGL
jgi:hypothetical protein